MSYSSLVSPEVKEYLSILEPDPPRWLDKYIQCQELQKQRYISISCGTIYTDLFDSHFFYSSLDHSIAVALVVWHFTHDKKQTLAGLFHDIATPAFKHCVDFLHGDYMNQEATEELTTKILQGSPDIVKHLRQDNIEISEVDDYHIYPIADNDTPQLSADRLEYSLANACFTYEKITPEQVATIYHDIEPQANENGEVELGFKTKKIAREFVKITSQMSVIYRDDRTRYSMQFIADILKQLNDRNLVTVEDLYRLKECEVIEIIESSDFADVFKTWRTANQIQSSPSRPQDVYYVHHGAKIRYVDPLYKGQRMSRVCKIAKKMIDNNLAYNMDSYVYLDSVPQFTVKNAKITTF